MDALVTVTTGRWAERLDVKEEILRRVNDKVCIQACHIVSGDLFQIFILCKAEDGKSLGNFIERIREIPQIIITRTCLIVG